MEKSSELTAWLSARGVRFQPALSGTLNLGRTNAFFLGGGRALLNGLCSYAEDIGIEFIYEAPVESLIIEDGFYYCAYYDERSFNRGTPIHSNQRIRS